MFFILSMLIGCDSEPSKNQKQNQKQDQFDSSASLRILEPSNGESVDSIFEVQYEAGDLITRIDVEYKGGTHHGELIAQVDVLENHESEDIFRNSFLIQVASGNHTLHFSSYDAQNQLLSSRDLTLNIDPLEHWITITSPGDLSLVNNPVPFVVNTSEFIEDVEFFVDGESIGFTDGQSPLLYEFQGLGYPQHITAKGYSYSIENETSDIVILAEHDIEITVLDGTTPLESSFNSKILDIISTYPTDGSYGYYWPQSGDWLGTTQDIYYLETLVAEGDLENRSFCVGLTWEVFMRAWQMYSLEQGLQSDINSMDLDDLDEFRIDWYVRELMGSGVVEAVENYGIGERITYWEDIQPGDFLQFWRNNGSGHNNIFINWERNSSDDIVGVTYWSTQGSTNGIGYNTEFFWPNNSGIDPAYFFAARIYEPQDWISFRE